MKLSAASQLDRTRARAPRPRSKVFLGEAAAQLAELATAGPRLRYAVDRALRR